MPGECDNVFFYASKAENFYFRLIGRKLVPFLGDAVPGWFQPLISIYDSDKNLLVNADDYYHDPDPILSFSAPKDGEYRIEIRDAIYRGREDFVYRLYTEKNFSLKEKQIQIAKPLRFSHLDLAEIQGEKTTYPLELSFPCLISNVFLKNQSTHTYTANFAKGEKIVFETFARRGGSPADSLIQIFDSDNKLICSNDDYKRANFSLLAQHADSYCSIDVKKSGKYIIKVSEIQRKSGKDYKYLLRIDRPQPDFDAFLYPSAINAQPGTFVPINLRLERFDNFNGDIKIKIKNAPDGASLSGGIIPADSTQNTFTIFVPPNLKTGIYPIQLSVSAEIEDRTIERDIIPCDEIMQAFIYKHLLPSSETLLCVGGRKQFLPAIKIPENLIFKQGEIKGITIQSAEFLKRKPEIEFYSAPDGLKIIETKFLSDSCLLKIQCAENAKIAAQNIIFQITDSDKKNNKRYPPIFLSPILTKIISRD